MKPTKIAFQFTFALLALLFTVPARAGLIINVLNSTATAGSTGNQLYVTVTNADNDTGNGAAPINLGGFAFEISALNTTDVIFTQVLIGAPAPYSYIFNGNSEFGPDITTSADPNNSQTIDAADNAAVPYSGTTLAVGATFGLGYISYDVLASAPPEAIQVSVSSYSATSFSDPNNNNVDYSVANPLGTIEIVAATVPEPTSLLMISIALTILGSFTVSQKLLKTRVRAKLITSCKLVDTEVACHEKTSSKKYIKIHIL
jgi:hypothetical protein